MLRFTPEEARALVEKHGSQRKAAAAIGIPRTTLQRWLDPEWSSAKDRRYYESLSGVEYNALLLRHRRYQALARMRKREQRRQEENSG